MADDLKRPLGPTNVGNGTNTVLTVPGGHKYSFKNITIINNTAAAITVKVGIGGVTDALLVIQPISIPANGGRVEYDGLIVLEAGETLQTNASATGCTITGNGLDQS